MSRRPRSAAHPAFACAPPLPGARRAAANPRTPVACAGAAARASALSRRAVLHLGACAPLCAAALLRSARAEGEVAAAPRVDVDPAADAPAVTTRVYFDVSIAGGRTRRFVVGCYGGLAPATVENFAALAARPVGGGGYAGTEVYRVVDGLTVQMGDVLGNGGRSGRAAGGGSMEMEVPRVRHTVPGIVSMARGVGGKVDSRFFVTTRPGDSEYLDVEGREYVGFGIVEMGMDVLLDMDRVGGRGGDSKPKKKIVIVDSGVLGDAG